MPGATTRPARPPRPHDQAGRAGSARDRVAAGRAPGRTTRRASALARDNPAAAGTREVPAPAPLPRPPRHAPSGPVRRAGAGP